MQKLTIMTKLLFLAAVFITGYGMGMCVKVFMARGVPIINGGGELVMLLAIPAAVYAGYRIGRKNAERRRSDEGSGHTD